MRRTFPLRCARFCSPGRLQAAGGGFTGADDLKKMRQALAQLASPTLKATAIRRSPAASACGCFWPARCAPRWICFCWNEPTAGLIPRLCGAVSDAFAAQPRRVTLISVSHDLSARWQAPHMCCNRAITAAGSHAAQYRRRFWAERSDAAMTLAQMFHDPYLSQVIGARCGRHTGCALRGAFGASAWCCGAFR